MTEELRLIVVTDAGQTIGEIRGLNQSLEQTEKQSNKTGKSASFLGDSLGKVATNAGLVFTAFRSIKGIKDAGVAIEDARRSLEAATGDALKSADALSFVRKEADRLGFEYLNLTKEYGKLASATRNTNLEGAQTAKVFVAAAQATRVFGGNANDVQGVLRALTQVMSKGTLQAEEIRGQIGERIPGAFRLAAQAMEVTQQELSEMLKLGQVTADEFLPKFADELLKASDAGAALLDNAPSTEFARLNNALTDFKIKVSEGGLMDALVAGARELIPLMDMVNNAFELMPRGFTAIYSAIEEALVRMDTEVRRWGLNLAFFWDELWTGFKNAAINRINETIAFLNTLQTAFVSVGLSVGGYIAPIEQAQVNVERFEQANRELDEQLEKQLAIINDARKSWDATGKQLDKTNKIVDESEKAFDGLNKSTSQLSEETEKWLGSQVEATQQMLDNIVVMTSGERALIELNFARAEAAAATDKERNAIVQAREEYLRAYDALTSLEDETDDYVDTLSDLLGELFPIERQIDEVIQQQIILNEAFRNGELTAREYAEALARTQEILEGLQRQQSATGQGFGGGFFGGLLNVFSQFAGSSGGGGVNQLFSAFGSFANASQAASNGGLFEGLTTGEFALSGTASAFNAISSLFGQSTGPRSLTQQGLMQGLGLIASSGGPWGAAAAALLAIDSITGGSLIGTSFSTIAQGQQFDFGPGGASGFSFQDQTRRRSLFRGSESRTLTTDLDAATQEMINEIFDLISDAIQQASDALGTEITGFVSGYWRTVTDDQGNTSTVSFFDPTLGDNAAPRRFQESFGDFQLRLLAENLIAAVSQTVGDVEFSRTVTNREVFGNEGLGSSDPQGIFGVITDIGNEAQVIAERWRDNAQDLLEGAQLMVQAQADIVDGNSLINGTLTETIDIVEEYASQNETLLETYQRMVLSTNIYSDALELIGQSFDGTREALVRFATEAAEAAGGTERMGELWQAYFQEFFSATELAEFSLNRANRRRDEELSDIGVSSDITNDAFRALFEDALPDLSPEELIEWLEAAEAIAAANAAQAAYNDTLGETSTLIEDILAEARDAGQAAVDALSTASPLEQAYLEITEFFDGLVAQAQEAGATQGQIAQIEIERQRALQAQAELAARELDQFLLDLQRGTEQLDMTPLQQALQAIQLQMEENILYAESLGATEEQLAEIRAAANAATAATLAEAQSQIDAIIAQAELGAQILSPLEQQLLSIEQATQGAIDAATALGATEAELEAIRAAGALAAQNAIDAAQNQIQAIIDGRDTQLAGLTGIDAELARIDAATAAALAQAEALGATEAQLAQIRAQGEAMTQLALLAEAERLELIQAQAEAAVREAEARRLEDLASLMSDVNNEITRFGLSDFENELRSIQLAFRQTKQDAIELGASIEELGQIEQLAALRTQQAINALKAETLDLISQLFGTPLDQINAQIAAIEQNANSGFGSIGNTINAVIDSIKANVDGLKDFIDGLFLSDVSPLTPQERLSEAQSQFDTLLQAALSGDQQAIDSLPAAAQALLDEASNFFASGSDFNAIFDQVTSAIQGIIDSPPDITVDNEPTGSASRPFNITPSAQMLALQEQRDALLAEQAANERIALATSIAENLNELASALGQPLWDIADELGVNVTELIEAFGIGLEDLTVETALALANVSNLLGVNLVELADQLDISLGSLADSQSLLNDALESQLQLLPPDLRDELGPLLLAIENATNDADANAAIEALEDATSGLPSEYRDLLAPFFEGIDPTDPLQEALNLQETANQELSDILSSVRGGEILLESISSNIREFNNFLDIPSYQTGTPYVPKDGLAFLHRGESVTPAAHNSFGTSNVAIPDSASVINELKRLRQEVASLRRENMQASTAHRRNNIDLLNEVSNQTSVIKKTARQDTARQDKKNRRSVTCEA